MTRLAFVLLLACVGLTACEDKDKEAAGKACGAAPAQMATKPTLPAGFPDAQGIRYTGIQKKGPTTVVSGYLNDTIGPAHQAYSKAIKNAAGYSVTHEEQDAADSEVNFEGNGKSGQVKMVQECKSRTTVTVTIRPA